MVSYIGHGGIDIWADENLLHLTSVGSLSPQPQQPLVLTMNCLNGYFHFPFFNSLSEELVKAERQGSHRGLFPERYELERTGAPVPQGAFERAFPRGSPRAWATPCWRHKRPTPKRELTPSF